MNVKFRILFMIWLPVQLLHAQSPDQITAYVNTYKLLAIAEMQRSGIPASIILAQGIHETQAGTSDLVIASNNHFGIKCKDTWTGPVAYHDDDARGECFRSYATAEDSYRDHSDFLSQSPRYAFLFKTNPEDYESWAYGLKKAGYATNIKYSQILIKLIRDYDLQRYSLIATGKLPPDQADNVAMVKKNSRETVEGFFDSTQKAPGAVNYPDGPFSINAAKVIYAKAGISLLSLSNQYEIPLARLLEFNELKQEDILINDQLVFLQRKRKTGSNPLHVVQPGESIYNICQTEGIRYESLLELNHLQAGEEPAPGEKIYLQTISGAKPVLRKRSQRENGALINFLLLNNFMTTLQIHDKIFKPYISGEAIQLKVREMAASINHDYRDKKPIFIAILNGAFIFAADLFRSLTIDAEISFIKLASYKGMKSSGQVITAIGLDIEIFNRHVVILEDIVDTGKTLNEFLPQLLHQQPASLKIVALLHKPEATVYPLKVDYTGFEIPDKFVVGYGLDYNGLGRNTARRFISFLIKKRL